MADSSHFQSPDLFAMQGTAQISNGVRLPPIHGHQVPGRHIGHRTTPLEPATGSSLASRNRWALIRRSKKRIIGKSLLGNIAITAGEGKRTCKKKIVVYVPESDQLNGFDSWAEAMTFLQDKKPQKWWLDSFEPPSFEVCYNGAKIKNSQGQCRHLESLIDWTGCDTAAVKLLCPWSIKRAWEHEETAEKGKRDESFNEKTPRDQFMISESFADIKDEIMLASFNMPLTTVPTPSFFTHPIMAERVIKEKYSVSAAADRSCDMPFIILRGKDFFVTYGWAPNGLSTKLRDDFIAVRAHAHSLGQSLKESALDELFAKAFEICISEIEALVDSSTAESDSCDADRKKFTTDEIDGQNNDQTKNFLHQVADNIVSCNRLLRSLLPKKAVCAAVDQVEWPDYISKNCRQRLESCVAVFSYLEEQASSNLEQLKSMQDSCLSMINLGLSNQGMEMNVIMQRFAVVTLIMAPLTLVTGFFGMNVPIPGPSMNPDEHNRQSSHACSVPSCALFLTWRFLKPCRICSAACVFLNSDSFSQRLCLVLVHSRVRLHLLCFHVVSIELRNSAST
jgi:hypothetical protein